MDKNEIKRYTEYGIICIDIMPIKIYPGIIRKVFFKSRNRVCIEFVGYDCDEEGGYEFCSEFSFLEEAIQSVEEFLEKPITQWINYTKTGVYPELLLDTIDLEQSSSDLLVDILTNKIDLPKRGQFKLRSTLPWRTLEEYKADLREQNLWNKLDRINN